MLALLPFSINVVRIVETSVMESKFWLSILSPSSVNHAISFKRLSETDE